MKPSLEQIFGTQQNKKPSLDEIFNKQVEQPNYLERVGQGFQRAGERVVEGVQKGAEQIQSGLQKGGLEGIAEATAGAGKSALRTVGSVAGAAFTPVLEAPGVKQGVDFVGENITKIPGAETIIGKANEISQKYPETAKDIEDLMNIAGLGLSKTIEQPIASSVSKGVKTGIDTTKAGVQKIKSAIPTKESVSSLLSPDLDPAFKKIIETTPTSKFDEIVKVAQEASLDLTKPSVYETVANSMSKATKQLDSQVKSLSSQKKNIISKAKTGLTDFSKETGETILNINRSLKDSPLATSFIEKLKNVKTKLDADNVIDELQDELYKGNKNMTIPTGSNEDRILKSILGEYNSKLKSSLPTSYSNINTKISNRLNVLETLNKALGEVVEGVPTRGAGLVKQFFSPAGTKTKELFKYIKDNTGVDLAQDAVLAKYIGEAFGDTKTRALLEGLPTSKTGVIDTTIDFVLEKTGTSQALKEVKQKSAIQKARKLTK